MISAPGHARETVPPMPGSCFVPDVNPFGSSRDYVEPRTTWCCSQVSSRRGKRTGACKPWPTRRCAYPDCIEGHLIVPHELPEDVGGKGEILLDPSGELHHRYGARSACLYVIRPDGYMPFRSEPPDPEALKSYFTQIFL
jgi:hypothetical protein